MPRIIYNYQNSMMGGLAPKSSLVGVEGMYAEGRDIDPYRKPGYIMPGFAESQIDAGTVLENPLLNIIVSTAAIDQAYAIDSGGSLYSITTFTFTTIAKSRDNSVSGATRGEDLILYRVNEALRLFYFYEDDAGTFDLTATYDDNFLSTVPSGAASLQDAPHPVGIFPGNNRLYIGNGRYLAEFNGNSSGGANGTLDATRIDLGPGWEITAIAITPNYILMGAWLENQDENSRTQAAVFAWDGVSDKPNKFIPIEDNFIEAMHND